MNYLQSLTLQEWMLLGGFTYLVLAFIVASAFGHLASNSKQPEDDEGA